MAELRTGTQSLAEEVVENIVGAIEGPGPKDRRIMRSLARKALPTIETAFALGKAEAWRSIMDLMQETLERR